MIRYWRQPDDPQFPQPPPIHVEPDDAYCPPRPPMSLTLGPAMLAAALAAVACGEFQDERPTPVAPAVPDEVHYTAKPPPQILPSVSAFFAVGLGECQDDPQFPQPPPLTTDEDYGPRWTRVWNRPGQGYSAGGGTISAAPSFVFEEDAWWWDVIYPATPGAPPNFTRPYLLDPDELDLPLPQNDLSGPDWIIPVFLGSPGLPPPLRLQDADEEIPAGSLYGQPDEDFWVSGVFPLVASNRVSLPWEPELDELPTTLSGAPDLDEVWRNPVAPVPGSLGRLYLPDPEELPAGSLTGQPDEDFWTSGVSPIPPRSYLVLPYLPDTEDQPPLYGVPEELENAPARPWTGSSAVRAVLADDDLPVTPTTLDEDSWISGVLPVQAGNRFSLPWLPDVEELPAGSLYGMAEEEFSTWPKPAPVIASDFLVLPFAPDVEEIPAADLTGQPDEDFPGPLPAPVPPRSFVLLPLGDPDSEVPSLYGQPDEDFWVSGVAPVPPRAYIVFPFLPDPEDVPALSGVPEEEPDAALARPWAATAIRTAFLADDEVPAPAYVLDEDAWTSGVPPTSPANRVSLPWEPELDELPTTLSGVPEEDRYQAPPPWPVVTSRALLPDADSETPFLYGQPDEDFWVSGVLPVVASNRVSLPWEPELDELPTTLTGQPDEDFPGPLPAPVPPRSFVVLPIGDPDSEVPSLYGAPEEDQFVPARPWPLPSARPFLADDEIPTPVLTYQIDEDFWTSGVLPVAPTNRVSLPWEPDVEELPAATLLGQPDEDFPGPFPAPVPGRNLVVLPLGDPDSEVPILYGQPDEDFWSNPVRPVVASNRVSLPWEPELDELPTTLSGQPDEDFPGPLPAPVQARNLVVLPLGDPDSEVPTLFGVPEEDAFRPAVFAPARAVLASSADDELASVLYPDEDFWSVPVGKSPPLPPRAFSDDDVFVPFVSTQIVEDEPYSAPVARPTGNFFALPYPEGTDEDVPRLYGVPEEDQLVPPRPWIYPIGRAFLADDEITTPVALDEDFWVSGVPPIPGRNLVVLPLEPDAEEIPAGSLTGQPDEDFWVSGVAPVPGSNRVSLPLGDPDGEIPAGSLFGTPDADELWSNPVRPVVASNRVPPPLLDLEELPAGFLRGPAEEDFWVSGVAPVPGRNFLVLPYVPDEDQDVPRLYGVPEEDRYSAPIPPPPPIVVAARADDEICRAVVDEDFFVPPPPWVNKIVRPFSEGDEWPTTVTPTEDSYQAPPPWPIPPPVVTEKDSDEWVPYVSTSLGMDEDFYAPPRQVIPLPPLRAFEGIEDETDLINLTPPSTVIFGRTYLLRPRPEIEPPHRIPDQRPARKIDEGPHGIPTHEDDDGGWL